jgi:hypothetical protein
MVSTDAKPPAIPNTIVAGQCIGCGRLEAPQNCIGICQNRMVELVSVWDHAEALVALQDANERIAALEAFVSKLAHTTPREGAWKDSYLALQKQARNLALGDH